MTITNNNNPPYSYTALPDDQDSASSRWDTLTETLKKERQDPQPKTPTNPNKRKNKCLSIATSCLLSLIAKAIHKQQPPSHTEPYTEYPSDDDHCST